jgi:hypothetical protein
MAIIWRYEATPGAAATAPLEWPAETPLARVPERATLVMLAHPHCPCTRASIGELALLMAHFHGRLTAHVLFLRPPGTPEEWEATNLWDSAAAIPGVVVASDPDGAQARRFGAMTSGQVVLYDASGRLAFSGGITRARGHAGGNPGRDAITAVLEKGLAAATETPVFGCSLVTPTS